MRQNKNAQLIALLSGDNCKWRRLATITDGITNHTMPDVIILFSPAETITIALIAAVVAKDIEQAFVQTQKVRTVHAGKKDVLRTAARLEFSSGLRESCRRRSLGIHGNTHGNGKGARDDWVQYIFTGKEYYFCDYSGLYNIHFNNSIRGCHKNMRQSNIEVFALPANMFYSRISLLAGRNK